MSPHLKPRELKGPQQKHCTGRSRTPKIMAPPTNCLSPIGEKAILSGLYKQIKGEFYTAVSRPPAVYRGNPFIIEAGLAYGNRPGDQPKPEQPAGPRAEGEEEDDDAELARVIRYANRVPLLYQQSACATFKAALTTTWKNYGVPQSRGALPAGPMVIFVHMASVWVPFTSESKEAIADYDEIQKEITLALRECGRRLGIVPPTTGTGGQRIPAAQHLRIVHRRGGRSLQPAQGREARQRQRLKCSFRKSRHPAPAAVKTDEALGRRAVVQKGLPHSIIVTDEGVEGEVGAASQVEAATRQPVRRRAICLALQHRPRRSHRNPPGRRNGTARHSTDGGPAARATRWRCSARPPTPNPSGRGHRSTRSRGLARNS